MSDVTVEIEHRIGTRIGEVLMTHADYFTECVWRNDTFLEIIFDLEDNILTCIYEDWDREHEGS